MVSTQCGERKPRRKPREADCAFAWCERHEPTHQPLLRFERQDLLPDGTIERQFQSRAAPSRAPHALRCTNHALAKRQKLLVCASRIAEPWPDIRRCNPIARAGILHRGEQITHSGQCGARNRCNGRPGFRWRAIFPGAAWLRRGTAFRNRPAWGYRSDSADSRPSVPRSFPADRSLLPLVIACSRNRHVIPQHLLLYPRSAARTAEILRDDVDALAVLVDHLRQAANLALDPLDAFDRKALMSYPQPAYIRSYRVVTSGTLGKCR